MASPTQQLITTQENYYGGTDLHGSLSNSTPTEAPYTDIQV